MEQFDRPSTLFYDSTIVTILKDKIIELDPKKDKNEDSTLYKKRAFVTHVIF